MSVLVSLFLFTLLILYILTEEEIYSLLFVILTLYSSINWYMHFNLM